MTQDEQRLALQKLKSGEVNVLVATSIAEEGLDIPEVDCVVFYEPVPSEIRYIQRRGRTGRKTAGKVVILLAEKTLDETFYWVSMTRTRKMKRLIGMLNKDLQSNYPKPALTLSDFQVPIQPSQGFTFNNPGRTKVFWKPHLIMTKGISHVLRWLNENLGEEVMQIPELVERASEETGSKKPVVETALWRLIQNGELYQPEPGKVKRIS